MNSSRSHGGAGERSYDSASLCQRSSVPASNHAAHSATIAKAAMPLRASAKDIGTGSCDQALAALASSRTLATSSEVAAQHSRPTESRARLR